MGTLERWQPLKSQSFLPLGIHSWAYLHRYHVLSGDGSIWVNYHHIGTHYKHSALIRVNYPITETEGKIEYADNCRRASTSMSAGNHNVTRYQSVNASTKILQVPLKLEWQTGRRNLPESIVEQRQKQLVLARYLNGTICLWHSKCNMGKDTSYVPHVCITEEVRYPTILCNYTQVNDGNPALLQGSCCRSGGWPHTAVVIVFVNNGYFPSCG